MIAIIDYGAGNLKNVQHALKTIGISSRITDQPSDLEKADGVILPGVGAYGEAMKRLSETGFDSRDHPTGREEEAVARNLPRYAAAV